MVFKIYAIITNLLFRDNRGGKHSDENIHDAEKIFRITADSKRFTLRIFCKRCYSLKNYHDAGNLSNEPTAKTEDVKNDGMPMAKQNADAVDARRASWSPDFIFGSFGFQGVWRCQAAGSVIFICEDRFFCVIRIPGIAIFRTARVTSLELTS